MFERITSKQNRALVAELVRTDFKLRYQGSILGYAWSLLRPFLIFVILYFVFVDIAKVNFGVPYTAVYLLLGIVLWNFFGETTQQSLTSIVARGDLIRKIRIPRWIIVISSSLSALINLGLNFIVVAVFMALNHVAIHGTILLLPFVILEIYVLALGLSFLLSALFVNFRDLSYIWEVMLQVGFYLTPILYPLKRISNVKIQEILMLNPMAQAMQDARYTLVTHATPTIYSVFKGRVYEFIPFIVVAVVLVVGVSYFKKRSKYFAENI